MRIFMHDVICLILQKLAKENQVAQLNLYRKWSSKCEVDEKGEHLDIALHLLLYWLVLLHCNTYEIIVDMCAMY